MDAIIIARVSTEDQKSGPAQIRRLREYCDRKAFRIIAEHDFDESAYKTQRAEFDAILKCIEAGKGKIAVCFDKVDRLSRNNFDIRVARLYERAVRGELELHFASDGQIINASISAVEKFQFGMSLGLAKYYSDAISDNVKRAFEHKRAKGEITGPPPFGYMSLHTDRDKRLRKDVIPDPERASYVFDMFKAYASGEASFQSIADQMAQKGVTTLKGRPLWRSVIQGVLANPFYYGVAVSKKYGVKYPHRYEPLIPEPLWRRVQAQMKKRSNNATHATRKQDFLLRPLFAPCPRCGCAITAQIKKGKHIYYGCSDGRGVCKRVYVNETVLTDKLQSMIGRLKFSEGDIDVIQEALSRVHIDRAIYHQERLARLQQEQASAHAKSHRLLELYLDEKISSELYEDKNALIEAQKTMLKTEIAMHSDADRGYINLVKTALNVMREAAGIFERSNMVEKRALIRIVFENLTLDGKTFQLSLRSPFDLLIKAERSDLLRGEVDLRTPDWTSISNHFAKVAETLPEGSELKAILDTCPKLFAPVDQGVTSPRKAA